MSLQDTNASTAAAPTPTPEDLLARALALVPVLKGRAAACEANRAVLDDTVADFLQAEFYRMLQPAAYGGYEMHPMSLFRVAMALAKGCPSSAWCLNLVAVHNWELALYPPQAAQDVWGADPDTRISSSYAPFGKIERVDGGFKVSGRWPWSSGSDHCQWVFLGGMAPTQEGAFMPDMRVFLIPRSDYRIDDTWHVMGLKGTGSKDIVVDGAFVPEHRTHKFLDSFMMQDVGLETFTSPNYRYPFGVIFAYCLSVVTLGMADGALEEFRAQMRERVGAYDGAKALEDPFVRQRLAEAEALIRGAHASLEAAFAEMDALLAAGAPLPVELRVQNKWNAQHTAKTAMQAIELLFKATGGRGIREENPMQRYFRDVHAASNHAYLNADKGAINAGGVLMGAQTMDFAL
ncbi:acyl-CoA dehydrogenase family protein [Caulobacter hibisci]|uniref:Flavin-dependent monooxygenase n=1 Tax=Caulobacter hibisci TaxID=2035993 RepID=A0ABS0SWU8_9CAUL|nr:acyl-CoA dehydrogenase family protein [Caulobacter hibisci]MBI1684117.1 flavin-dependent monooxygenase [Caulobacter hibisci]